MNPAQDEHPWLWDMRREPGIPALQGGEDVKIISFGYGHCRPRFGRRRMGVPVAHAIYDLRHHFRDPHVTPGLRDLTGAHATIENIVLGTPGILVLVAAIVAAAAGFRGGPQPGGVTIAIGCVGGRHRSVAVAAEVARRLDADGIPVILQHRDISRPVIRRRTARKPGDSGEQAARTASLRACGLRPWHVGLAPVPPRVRLWRAVTRWRTQKLKETPMPLLFTQLEGEMVPLADCDWVLFAPCGCPVGLTVASAASTEDLAWASHYPRKRERDAARRDGYRMVLMTRDRWAAEFMPAMQAGCRHTRAGQS